MPDDTDPLLRVAAAAEAFVREFRASEDDSIAGRAERRRRQQAALDALMAEVDAAGAERAAAS
jgi:hypothetical protein